MKKINVIIMISILLTCLSCFLCGCNTTPKIPAGTKWVSEDPDMYIIFEHHTDRNPNVSYYKSSIHGGITVNDEETEFIMGFIFSPTAVVHVFHPGEKGINGDEIMKVYVNLIGKDKIRMKIENCKEGWLDPSVETIIFIKDPDYIPGYIP